MDTQVELNEQILNKITLDEFKSQLTNLEDKLKGIDTLEELNKFIVSDFTELTEHYTAFGDYVYNKALSSDKTADAIETHFVNFSFPEDFKSIIILHRDVFLELAKAAAYKHENQISEREFITHFQSSKGVIKDAIEHFKKMIAPLKSESPQNVKYRKKIQLKLSLQDNPWPIYKEQYHALLNHIKEIETSRDSLLQTIAIFNQLKQSIDSVSKKHKVLVEEINESVTHIINNLKGTKELSKLRHYVDDQLSKHNAIETEHQSILLDINNLINELDRIDVPMSAIDGLLSKRDVDFKKRTQKWFDYRILPEFMDLMSIESSLVNKYNLNLLNLSNSLKHSKSVPKEGLENILNALSHLKEEIIEEKDKGEHILEIIKDKITQQLIVTDLIKGNPFLEVKLNSSIGVDGSTFLKRIKETVKRGNAYFNKQYKKSLRYQSLSNFELSVQCIAHRMYKDDSSYYDSLFLNKMFIGDLFLVPRQEQEDKLKFIIDQWHQGYNKSVLISGDRLSGRSTFLDYTSKSFFGKHIVSLNPNSNATIDGRKFKTSYDLKEALNYVKNNNLKSTKPVLLIDDVELWRDADHSLLYNIRALIDFIETESENAFVMISTTTLMLEHLNDRLNFSNSISHSISVNEADSQEITEAILRRHGASHRDLISEDLKPISINKIKAIAQKLSKLNHYNFGNTLQAWTYRTFVQDNEKIVLKESYYEFLDFFTPQEIIVLKQALIFKTVSEYGLKRVTSLSYDLNFQPAVRRLVNTKVLLRDRTGNLFINPIVVNDVTNIVRGKMNNL